MAIQVASFLIPKNGNLWYVLEDKYIKGGLHVVASNQDRDDILDVNRKQGMLVIVSETGKVWSLQEDLLEWKEFKVGGGSGGVRQSVTKIVVGIAAQDHADFELSLGATTLIHKLEVDQICQVEAFSTAERAEDNPYRFVSTIAHLEDDGSTLMSDGTILRGRRYHILSNLEPQPSSKIYFRLTNLEARPPLGDVPTKDIVLKISFLPLEGTYDIDPSLNT